MINKPKNICLLRLSAIGDVCHAVAVVQAIQRAWPEVPITWVIGKLEASLVRELLPQIEFIIFDKSAGFKAFRQLRKAMRGCRFDVLLHMQVALRASFASLCIPAKIRLGFDRLRAKDHQWLFTNQKIRHQPRQHVVESFWGFLLSLGIRDQAIEWNISIPVALREWAISVIQDRDTVIINPATSMQSRNWSVEGYAAVARYAVQRGLQVIITGGPTAVEQQLATQIIAQSDPSVKSMVGKTSLLQLLALIEQANVVIAPDTGPAHMATLVGTPVLGLFAASNPDRTCAYKSREWVVNAYPQAVMQQYKKSVAELPWGKRVRNASAMKLISPQVVCNMLDKLLRASHNTI